MIENFEARETYNIITYLEYFSIIWNKKITHHFKVVLPIKAHPKESNFNVRAKIRKFYQVETLFHWLINLVNFIVRLL